MNSNDAWTWLIVYYVIFAGITNGVLAWTAAFRVAQTRWTPAINRLGHSTLAFWPVMFMALIVLLSGVRYYMPWVHHPVSAKAAWLNVPFMVTRDIACVVILGLLYLLMIRWGLEADAKTTRGENITNRDQFKLSAISTAAIMFYTIAGTIIAYDLIMSLSPEWVSTMFAPYIWITNMYAGLAILIIMSTLLRGRLNIERYLTAQQFQDLGNLMLGFSLFSMGLFFAQYLTIWYENLPMETHFLILRYDKGPWIWPGWTAFIIGYAIPFILLQSRQLKRNPRWLSIVAVLVIFGVALERYVLIVPSIDRHRLMISPLGLLGIPAFLVAFIYSVAWFLKRYPSVSSADEALNETEFRLEIAP